MSFINSLLPVTRKRLVTIEDAAPVVDAARLLTQSDTNLVVVCHSDGSMSGVITKADVVRQISHCTGCSCATMVSEIMSREVVSCQPDHVLYDVWLIMKQHGLKQIPVAGADSRPVGVLYANDALQALLKESEYEEDLLRDYVMGIGYH